MAAYIITYDLRRPGQNYVALITAIMEYPHRHVQGSVWIVSTRHNADQIFQSLSEHLAANDELFVSRLSDAVSVGYSEEVSEWLRKVI